jgi:hypothetical protein
VIRRVLTLAEPCLIARPKAEHPERVRAEC